ncbi:MAG TPA: hypothetical protein VGM23_12700, partial [Armatimonadota bacterium]
MLRSFLLSICLLATLAGAVAQQPSMREVEVKTHLGRPMIFVDGQPNPFACYCPIGWSKPHFLMNTKNFYPHHMNCYQIMPPGLNSDLSGTQFLEGDTVSSTPLFVDEPAHKMQGFNSFDESANDVIAKDPNAYLIVRTGMMEPESWRKLHPEQYFVTDDGTRGPVPSMASDLYWEMAAKYSRALIQFCESRPWANRIIGYVNIYFVEGCDQSVIEGWLFDHNPQMTARWRAFLQAKYGAVERLRAAWGDQTLTFETVEVPKDKLRGPTPVVSNLLYWQGPKDNQPLRDYLELRRDLFHQRFKQIIGAERAATERKRFFVYDAFKQTMQGWNCGDFFYNNESRRLACPDLMGGSGSIDVAQLYDLPGFSGILTPHDYQARGVGGTFEPEGIADSLILHNKIYICEMDQRSYVDKNNAYGNARDFKEYAAITWRNIATSLTRGFYFYWMDLYSDWYKPAEIQQLTARQVDVVKESVNWPHETVPGIAMIIDDKALYETNGSGNTMYEAVMWEQKMGLARCGVPVRIYLLEDLKLPTFPKHRVFYFPNLYKVDDARLALLKEKVFRDGNVVVWGPGSGISDGQTISAANVQRLTGFTVRLWPVNYPHRVQITNFDHPITRGLPADTIINNAVSYGPLVFPLDGTQLG